MQFCTWLNDMMCTGPLVSTLSPISGYSAICLAQPLSLTETNSLLRIRRPLSKCLLYDSEIDVM